MHFPKIDLRTPSHRKMETELKEKISNLVNEKGSLSKKILDLGKEHLAEIHTLNLDIASKNVMVAELNHQVNTLDKTIADKNLLLDSQKIQLEGKSLRLIKAKEWFAEQLKSVNSISYIMEE